MPKAVPFVDLLAQQREIDEALQEDLRSVFATAGFIGGPHVAAFEEEYAQFVGVSHCVGLGNGTDAVEFAIRALDIGPGDEVIAPANTFVATIEAICRAGATPVLVDVDENALLMEPKAVANAVTSRTRAIVPVHLYGQIAPVEVIEEMAPGLAIIEDAAQSQGATRHGKGSGSFGSVAATSFYPGKNLGAAGDAGAVTTNDASIARAVRLLGNHGSERKYAHDSLGFNSRLDAIQAVVLRHKLHRLHEWNALRRHAARYYHELLSAIDGVRPPITYQGNDHVWHLYVVRVDERDRVLRRMQASGIGAALHYPCPVHLTSAFASLGYGKGSFPVTEQAAGEILSLPMFPHITRAQQERVAEALAQALV